MTYTYDSAGRMTQVQDQRSNVVTVVYDSSERVGTIALPDGATQLFSSYQEQGWTNSGTSGSPAAATLLAEAATTYTDPNGNTFQTRPDWMGLGQLGQATDAYGNVTSNDLNSNGLPDRLDRPARSDHPVQLRQPGQPGDDHLPRSDERPIYLQLRLRALDPHRRQRAYNLIYLRFAWQSDGHPGPPSQPDDDDLYVDRTGPDGHRCE